MAIRDAIYNGLGLTPQSEEEANQLNAIMDRLRMASMDAGKGESETPGFGMMVQNPPKPVSQTRPPDAEAPSTSGWRAGLEPSERLEKAEPKNFTVPQTAPLVQPARQAQAPQAQSGPPSEVNPQRGGVPKVPAPDFWDRLGAFSRGYNTGGLVGAVADGMGSGLDRQVESQNVTAQALVKLGVAPELVTAATRNPDIMKALVTAAFSKQAQRPEYDVVEAYDEKSGRKQKYFVNKHDPTQRMPFGGVAGDKDDLTAGDRKAIRDEEKRQIELKGVEDRLNQALGLNDKIFTGITSGPLGWLGTQLPEGTPGDIDGWVSRNLIDRPTAEATQKWKQIMSLEAIKAMATTLKGATTNFELDKFVEILADPSQPESARRDAIQYMIDMARGERETGRTLMDQIRGGTYYTDKGGTTPAQGGGGAVTPEAAPAPAPSQRGIPEKPPANARTLPDGRKTSPNPNNPKQWIIWDKE
jgi:hypothetical protein